MMLVNITKLLRMDSFHAPGKKPASKTPSTKRRPTICVHVVKNPKTIIVTPHNITMDGRKILGPTLRSTTVANG